MGCWSPDPSARDAAVVVRAPEFARVGYVVEGGTEAFEKKRSLPGSTRLQYRFQGRCNGRRSFGTSTLAVDRESALTAWLSYRMLAPITQRMLPDDAVLRDVADGFAWGDESSHQTLLRGGVPRGTIFHGRRGDKLFLFVARDVYFPDGQGLGRFLGPHLAALERY